jgi:hypothetical protein
MVAVRGPDGRLFTAIYNGRIRPVRIPEPDSLPARFAHRLVALAAAAGVGWARKGGTSGAQSDASDRP